MTMHFTDYLIAVGSIIACGLVIAFFFGQICKKMKSDRDDREEDLY